MPYLNVKVSVALSPGVPQRIATSLTDLTAQVLGKKKELTSVAVEHVPPEQWFIGGVSVHSEAHATVYLDIKVTEGTNTKEEKAAYVKQAFAALESILGKLDPASYVVVHDVRADAWGYGGETQELRYIRGKPL